MTGRRDTKNSLFIKMTFNFSSVWWQIIGGFVKAWSKRLLILTVFIVVHYILKCVLKMGWTRVLSTYTDEGISPFFFTILSINSWWRWRQAKDKRGIEWRDQCVLFLNYISPQSAGENFFSLWKIYWRTFRDILEGRLW